MTIEKLMARHCLCTYDGAYGDGTGEYVPIRDEKPDAHNLGLYSAPAIKPAEGPDADGLYRVYRLAWEDREEYGADGQAYSYWDWFNPDNVIPEKGRYDLERDCFIQ